jgi:hypothetical protein
MGIKLEAKRVKYGQSLEELEKQGLTAVNQLKGIKVNIVVLKNAVDGDSDFDQEDSDEVQATIDLLLSEIESI